jgi:hypothetical protein
VSVMDVARLEGDEDMEAVNAWSIAHGVDRIEDMSQLQLRMWPHVATAFSGGMIPTGRWTVWWSDGEVGRIA